MAITILRIPIFVQYLINNISCYCLIHLYYANIFYNMFDDRYPHQNIVQLLFADVNTAINVCSLYGGTSTSYNTEKVSITT